MAPYSFDNNTYASSRSPEPAAPTSPAGEPRDWGGSMRRGARLGLLVFLVCAFSLSGLLLLWSGTLQTAVLGFHVVYEEAMRIVTTDATWSDTSLPRIMPALGRGLLRCGAGAGFLASAIYFHRRLRNIFS